MTMHAMISAADCLYSHSPARFVTAERNVILVAGDGGDAGRNRHTGIRRTAEEPEKRRIGLAGKRIPGLAPVRRKLQGKEAGGKPERAGRQGGPAGERRRAADVRQRVDRIRTLSRFRRTRPCF